MGALLPLTGQPVSKFIYHWPTQSIFQATVIDLGRPDPIETVEEVEEEPWTSEGRIHYRIEAGGPKGAGVMQRAIRSILLRDGPQTTAQLVEQLADLWPDTKTTRQRRVAVSSAMRRRSGDPSLFVEVGKTKGLNDRDAIVWGVRGVHPESLL